MVACFAVLADAQSAVDRAQRHCLLPEAIYQQSRHVWLLQTDDARRELAVEKAAHVLTAGKSQREVEAYSIALRQAEAELDQQRLAAVQQLAGKQGVLHLGPMRSSNPASTLLAPHQRIPSFRPSQEATWRVNQVLSTSCFTCRANVSCTLYTPTSLCDLPCSANWRLDHAG